MKTKKDFLQLLKEDMLSKIAKTEVDLELFSSMNETDIVGQDTSGEKPRNMTAKEQLEIQLSNLKVFSDRLTAIEKVLKRNKK